jgi:YD repeat-containing protein
MNAATGTSTYVYDANGRRIRKTTVLGGAVDFLYDLAGHEIAQFNSGTWTRAKYMTMMLVVSSIRISKKAPKPCYLDRDVSSFGHAMKYLTFKAACWFRRGGRLQFGDV